MSGWYENIDREFGILYWHIEGDRYWHVTYNLANTLVQDKAITEDGWYWSNWHTLPPIRNVNRLIQIVGPFNSADAAKADCESAHKND